MVLAAARAVQPPDLPLGTLLRQRLQHGEDRGGTDPGADQQQGRPRLVEEEGAARRADVEPVTDREPGVQVRAGGAAHLALDGDPVDARVRPAAQGVVAQT